MLVASKPRPGRAPPLPAPARRVVEAVRKGRGQAYFPPVAQRGPERVLTARRGLQGEEDARLIGALLARPRFRPLLAFLEALDGWCRSMARRYPKLLGPRVLSLTHAELFGPLISEAFTLCAAAGDEAPHPHLRTLLEGFQASLSLFLARLARDVRAGVLRRAGFHEPVVGVWANPEETHNGRQCVLRLRFRKGGALAYKPRPAGGEALFLAEGHGGAARSLFELLNRLPAASGAVRLPTMRVLEGTGPDGFAYSWQEWIARPRQWGTLRRAEDARLEGCQLTPPRAKHFWHRAGSLTAACFALGAADLFGGNLLVGTRPGTREPLFYPVDLELFFSPLKRLTETGLVSGVKEDGNHHVGLERLARWCTAGGPLVYFSRSRDGGLRLKRRREPWGREETRSVVGDTEGNVGFGAYLLPYLRGMFDVWTLLLMERPKVIAFLRRASRRRFVRVLVKPTGAYSDELDRMFLAPGREPPTNPGGGVRFSREEREQLRRCDVPYFFRPAQGGPLLYLSSPPASTERRQAGRQQFLEPNAPPSEEVLDGAQLDLMKLGVAVRDAIAYVFPDVRQRVCSDARGGVHIALRGAQQGSVSFDWPEVGKRLTYSWNLRELRVSMDSV